MRIVCPHCSARLQLPTAPEPDVAVKCPKCREAFFPSADEAEPADPAPARSGYRRPDQKAGKKFPVAIVVGIVAVLAAGGVAVALLAGGGKDKPVADKGKVTAPTELEKKGKTNPKPAIEPVAEKQPPELAALFRAPVAEPPAPAAFVPTLEPEPKAPELTVSAGGAPKDPPADDRTPDQVREDVKRSTVFIKVSHPTGGGTGSGFVLRTDGTTAWIGTNHHVVFDKAGDSPGQVSVVFDSGDPTAEQELPAQVLTADAAADLAVVRVTGVKKMPKPLDPALAPKPTETLPVRACGYPLAGLLGGGRNPSIVMTDMTVSSLQRDAGGQIETVLLNGNLNPGNSGGPVVDMRGRLVGIARAKIKENFASGIGLAVPAAVLAAMLDGRLRPPAFEGTGVEDGRAVFRVAVPVQDPLRRLKGAGLHVLAGVEGTAVKAEFDATTGWKPLAGSQAVELTLDPGKAATGTLRLPAADNQSVAVFQLSCTAADGTVVVSQPVPFKLTRDGARAAAAAIPLADLDRSPEKYDGQVVVVRGKTTPATLPKLGVFEMDVVGESGAKPVNLTFLTAAEVASQLRELPDAPEPIGARLTCRVGKKGADGVAPVRVTKVEFLDRSGRARMTIPSDELAKDPLVALNRSPDRFAGQELTLVAQVSPTPLVKGMEAELVVMFQFSDKAPDNLAFVTTRDLASQLNAEGAKADAILAVLTARLDTKKIAGKRVVTVTRIVLLGPDRQPRRTIE